MPRRHFPRPSSPSDHRRPGQGWRIGRALRRGALLAALLGVALTGCGQAHLQQPGTQEAAARLEPQAAVAEDGYRLPLRHWPAEGETRDAPRALVLAVHGFNDHGGSFDVMAEALAPYGIATYAFDQRGFGLTAQRRLWPGHARLEPQAAVAEDGYRLPLRHWPAEGEARDAPRALVLAVHGFNDHGGSFDVMAEALAPYGIATYAFDQRGFGLTAQRRLWPGHARLVGDVRQLVALLQARHPDTPLYLVGKSMGAAVVLLTLADDPPPVAGSVLIAPAVWGLDTMPWYQRAALWLGVRLMPSASFSARSVRRLGIEPTDDPEIMARLARDPLILRSARVDTLYGVSEAMSLALPAAERLPGPALILYGDEDQVIPAEAACALLDRLPERGGDATGWRLALYPAGYHMLTRYSQRQRTEADLAAWLLNPRAALPSGHEVNRTAAREQLACPD